MRSSRLVFLAVGLVLLADASAWSESRLMPPGLSPVARLSPEVRDGVVVGIRVENIAPGSWWDRLGIQNGEVILEVDGIPLGRPDGREQLLAALRDGSGLVLVEDLSGGVREIHIVIGD